MEKMVSNEENLMNELNINSKGGYWLIEIMEKCTTFWGFLG